MPRFRVLILLVPAACLSVAQPLVAAGRERLDRVRIPFVENCGQFDERVAFAAPTFSGTEFVTRDGALVYGMSGGGSLRETFVARAPRPSAGLPTGTVASYFVGDRPDRWQRGLATYGEVDFGEIWPGISVLLRADGRTVEKVFVLQPGSRVQDIRLRVAGAGGLRVDAGGAMVAEAANARVRFTPPSAYQEVDGARRPVPVAYVLRGEEYGFRIGRHDPALAVVIDPIFQSTYLGGSDLDSISAIAVHPSSGEVLVMGGTVSADFPGTAGGAVPTFGGTVDSYVARLDPTLTRLLQVTYFGGSGQEGIGALAVDPSSGDVLIGGFTQSTDLPGAPGGAQPAKIGTGEDGYVARFDASLTRLIQSTYFGGTGDDFVTALAVDASTGEVLVAGNTSSTDLPATAGAAQPSIATSADSAIIGVHGDGFVARLDSALTTIVRTTYVGGTDEDRIFGIALQDSTGEVLVAGDTASTDFPKTAGGGAPEARGVYDGFVARFDSGLTTLRQATYFGGTNYDGVLAIAVQPATQDVFVAGFASSTDLPGTSGAAQPSSAGGDADGFVARFDSALTTLRRATYLGGGGGDFLYALAIHPNGEVYVAGETGSADFPGTAGGAQANYVGAPHPQAYASDVFVTRLDASLSTILQSTFLGGTGEEDARAIALDPSTSSVYVAGETSSADFPAAAGGAQPAYVGGGSGSPYMPAFEGFVSRLGADLSNGSCQASADALCLNGNRFAVAVAWQVPADGRSGAGKAVPLTGDTGMFWFFDPANIELVVKVLDGTTLNGNYWVFYAGLSNVAYTITITDLRTGQVRKYENPSGTIASAADTSAFEASSGASGVPAGRGSAADSLSRTEIYALYELLSERPKAAEPINPCAAGGTTLCLLGGRFRLTVDWEIPGQGRSGHGVAAPITNDTGSFWFFDEGNVELAVKVLDGRALNGRFWLFVGGLTDVRYTLRVTDTETGATRTWNNTEGDLTSWADTAAF